MSRILAQNKVIHKPVIRIRQLTAAVEENQQLAKDL
jgi:hypothetical protein